MHLNFFEIKDPKNPKIKAETWFETVGKVQRKWWVYYWGSSFLFLLKGLLLTRMDSLQMRWANHPNLLEKLQPPLLYISTVTGLLWAFRPICKHVFKKKIDEIRTQQFFHFSSMYGFWRICNITFDKIF